MNTPSCTPPEGTATDMLAEVDFKWLMAGQGCWIDPQRLLADPVYANHCLQTAMHSPCDALRQCARALQAALLPLPHAH